MPGAAGRHTGRPAIAESAGLPHLVAHQQRGVLLLRPRRLQGGGADEPRQLPWVRVGHDLCRLRVAARGHPHLRGRDEAALRSGNVRLAAEELQLLQRHGPAVSHRLALGSEVPALGGPRPPGGHEHEPRAGGHGGRLRSESARQRLRLLPRRPRLRLGSLRRLGRPFEIAALLLIGRLGELAARHLHWARRFRALPLDGALLGSQGGL
mmetsp:Transcript_76203/g.213684  ORF Transcript_76203/g.213684 Transcript_76203/m.213684 type:complete len:209 (+) Transcript_76203:201-827(+)